MISLSAMFHLRFFFGVDIAAAQTQEYHYGIVFAFVFQFLTGVCVCVLIVRAALAEKRLTLKAKVVNLIIQFGVYWFRMHHSLVSRPLFNTRM